MAYSFAVGGWGKGGEVVTNDWCRHSSCKVCLLIFMSLVLRGFRLGPTQTRLYSNRRWLEAYNLVFMK